MRQIAEIVGEVGVDAVDDRLVAVVAVLAERHLAQEEIAELVDAVMVGECEGIDDPYDALATMMRRHAESTEGDVAFQLAMLKLNDFHWDGIEEDKAALNAVVSRIIERAQSAGSVRADVRAEDYGMMMCGITATMHFMGGREWRRHLDLILAGLQRR